MANPPSDSPPYCKACSTCVMGMHGATRMHPIIDFWLCDRCWKEMTAHQKADLKLRLMEMALKREEIDKIDSVMDVFKVLGERQVEEKDDEDWWKKGRGGDGGG